MTAPDPSEPGLLLPRAGQAVDRLLRRAVAAHDLTPTSLGVLGVLVRGGPAAHRELAAELGVAPGTLTPAVDALERAGQVVRVRDTADRRVVRVSTTAAGRVRYGAAFAAVAGVLRDRVPQPPPAVRDYLQAVLDALDA
jgi:DNA-binding MarR family transcriptional regulator